MNTARYARYPRHFCHVSGLTTYPTVDSFCSFLSPVQGPMENGTIENLLTRAFDTRVNGGVPPESAVCCVFSTFLALPTL
jgi:hypothetical protein